MPECVGRNFETLREQSAGVSFNEKETETFVWILAGVENMHRTNTKYTDEMGEYIFQQNQENISNSFCPPFPYSASSSLSTSSSSASSSSYSSSSSEIIPDPVPNRKKKEAAVDHDSVKKHLFSVTEEAVAPQDMECAEVINYNSDYGVPILHVRNLKKTPRSVKRLAYCLKLRSFNISLL